MDFFQKNDIIVLMCVHVCLEKSNHVCFKKPFLFNALSVSIICSFSMSDISSQRGWFSLGSFRCNIAFLIYSCLSSTTIMEPLSALLITSLEAWWPAQRASRNVWCFMPFIRAWFENVSL